MKQRKAKDILVKNVLDDLKNIPEDESIVIGPDGIQPSEHIRPSARQVKTSVKPSSSSWEGPADEQNSDRTLILGEENSSEPSSPVMDSEIPSRFPAAPDTNSSAELEKSEIDRTLLVGQVANRSDSFEPKVSFGGGRGKASSFETQFSQAENLRMAQQRILELEKETDRLRKENELLSSASEISRSKMDEMASQIQNLERQKNELREVNESELQIFKDGLSAKDAEIVRLRTKVDELELRLANDLRKVRVRERELENRLELSKAEKVALLKAKDDSILELKRKTETLESEIETYQNKVIELGQKIESNQEQFARTVRALRLALTNLEVSDGTSPSITLAPIKKAE